LYEELFHSRGRVRRKIERWACGRDELSGLTENLVERKVFVGRGVDGWPQWSLIGSLDILLEEKS